MKHGWRSNHGFIAVDENHQNWNFIYSRGRIGLVQASESIRLPPIDQLSSPQLPRSPCQWYYLIHTKNIYHEIQYQNHSQSKSNNNVQKVCQITNLNPETQTNRLVKFNHTLGYSNKNKQRTLKYMRSNNMTLAFREG